MKKKLPAGLLLLNQRNLKEFVSNWAQDAVFVYPGKTPISGRLEGKKAIEEGFTKFLEQFPKINFTIKHIYIENIFAMGKTNRGAIEWDITITNRENKTFQNSGVTVIYAKNGKATFAKDYIFDVEKVEQAWGVGV